MTLPARAAVLAAELSRTRIITPTLTDDAATLTVVLDVVAILAALEDVRREALEEAIKVADGEYLTDATNEADDVAYDQAVRHIVVALRELIDPPDSKRPGTPEDDGSDET